MRQVRIIWDGEPATVNLWADGITFSSIEDGHVEYGKIADVLVVEEEPI